MNVITNRVQFDNICRTCLSEEANMKSVFDMDYSVDEALHLFEMLMTCTSVQVQEDDGLPAQMCLSCIDCIARSFAFKKLCEQSDSTLREMLSESTITDDEALAEMKPYTNVALCSQEVLADIDRDTLEIKIEFEEGETNIDDLTTSETDYSICERKDLKIIEVTNNFDMKSDDIKVELMHDDQIDFEPNTLITDNANSACAMPDYSEPQIYHCEQCNACFILQNDLKLHSDTHQKSTKHKCKVCSRSFSSFSEFSEHVLVHDDAKPHLCTQCGKGFRRLHHLRVHSKTHGVKSFVCKLCDKRFARSFGLAEHMRAHANERNYICSECGKGFSRLTTFNSHIKTHPALQTHTCHICEERFFGSRHLTLHMKKHTGIPSTTCTVCGKDFRDATSLSSHMKTHTGEKDHVCADCGKGFATAGNLKVHQRIHTDERPYICNVCNKGFRHSSHLIEHVRTHSGEKPYVCTVCGKGCASSSNLKKHMPMHTGEKPFQCGLCPKVFRYDGNLRIHIIKVHTVERKHIRIQCKEKGVMRLPS